MSTQINRITLKNLPFLCGILSMVISCQDTDKEENINTIGLAEERQAFMVGEKRDYNDKEVLFLYEAAEANLLEIQLCQLAQKKSINKDVKELANMIELAQNKLKLELELMAMKKSIDLPTVPNNRTNVLAANLSHESTETFDNLFCDLMVKNNRNTIEMFDRAIPEINDVQIKDWAAHTITELVSRIDFAMTCQSKYQLTSK